MKKSTKTSQGQNSQIQGAKYVSAATVAKRYSVTERYVHQLAEQGIIPMLRLGVKCVRFDLESVIEALEGGKGGR